MWYKEPNKCVWSSLCWIISHRSQLFESYMQGSNNNTSHNKRFFPFSDPPPPRKVAGSHRRSTESVFFRWVWPPWLPTASCSSLPLMTRGVSSQNHLKIDRRPARPCHISEVKELWAYFEDHIIIATSSMKSTNTSKLLCFSSFIFLLLVESVKETSCF